MKAHFLTGAVLAVAIAALALARANHAEPLTRDALSRAFDSGLRNTVIHWDDDDPRSLEERRRSCSNLFAKHDASAADSAVAFDGNLVTQAVVGTLIRSPTVGLVLATIHAFRRSAWRRTHRRSEALNGPSALVCHTAEIDGGVFRRRHENVR